MGAPVEPVPAKAETPAKAAKAEAPVEKKVQEVAAKSAVVEKKSSLAPWATKEHKEQESKATVKAPSAKASAWGKALEAPVSKASAKAVPKSSTVVAAAPEDSASNYPVLSP